MQSLLFNLTFQMVFTINNSKNVPPVLLLYSVNPGILLDEEQLYVAQFTQGIINWNHRLISEQWNKDISIPRGWSHKKCSYFSFAVHSKFIFDIFWSILSTSTFGNSCSTAGNTPSLCKSICNSGFVNFCRCYHLS